VLENRDNYEHHCIERARIANKFATSHGQNCRSVSSTGRNRFVARPGVHSRQAHRLGQRCRYCRQHPGAFAAILDGVRPVSSGSRVSYHMDASLLLPVPACKPKDRVASGVCHARGMRDSGRHRVVVTDPVAGLHVLEIERPV